MKLVKLTIFLASGILLTSCSAVRQIPVQRDSTTVTRIDSVLLVDSVYIDRIRVVKEKADTVYVTDTKTEIRYRYRDRVKIDTCFRDREITRTVEVERQLTAWQKFWITGGKIFALIILVSVVFLLIKMLV